MNYSDLVEACKKHRRIIVTGPQRSGTTFASKALAKSLDYVFVDESRNPNQEDHYVWQFASKVHSLHKRDDYDLVIWMNRDKKDVELSEKRIQWSFFEFHRDQYRHVFGDEAMTFDNNYDMKHYFWNKVQKKDIKSKVIEFDYERLSDAPGFLSKNKRVNFSSKQTC